MPVLEGEDDVDLGDAVVEEDVGLAGREREVALPSPVELQRKTFSPKISGVGKNLGTALAVFDVVVRRGHFRAIN